MTNLDIETFWAVVQHGTMTAAAEALYITQPTLSMRIRALEERVLLGQSHYVNDGHKNGMNTRLNSDK